MQTQNQPNENGYVLPSTFGYVAFDETGHVSALHRTEEATQAVEGNDTTAVTRALYADLNSNKWHWSPLVPFCTLANGVLCTQQEFEREQSQVPGAFEIVYGGVDFQDFREAGDMSRVDMINVNMTLFINGEEYVLLLQSDDGDLGVADIDDNGDDEREAIAGEDGDPDEINLDTFLLFEIEQAQLEFDEYLEAPSGEDDDKVEGVAAQ